MKNTLKKQHSLHQYFILAVISVTASTPTAQAQRIAVDDKLPLMTVLRELELKYGWLITFEAPPIADPNELEDVTHPDYRRAHPDERPALAARRHYFEFALPVPPNGTEPDAGGTIRDLVAAYNSSGLPDRYQYRQIGAVFHVYPSAVRRPDGSFLEIGSVLDTPVNLPRALRTSWETVLVVLQQVSENVHQAINLTSNVTNGLHAASGDHEAINAPARDILMAAFNDVNRPRMMIFNEPSHIKWNLVYNPGMKCYYFNAYFMEMERKSRLRETGRTPK